MIYFIQNEKNESELQQLNKKNNKINIVQYQFYKNFGKKHKIK